MVQELAGYDSCAMHPAIRQTQHNMNAYSYSGPQPQYTPDYGQYHQLTDAPGLQQTMSGTCSSTGWPGMYVGAPTAVGPGRSPSGLDDWTAFMTTQTMQGHPNAGYGYRPGALPTDMNYGQNTHSPLPVTSLPNLNHSPETPGMMCSSPGSNVAMTGRQTRPPFDWMKKQAFQSPLVNEMEGVAGFKAPTRKTRTKDKYRIVYSEYQKVELEKEYMYSKYITIQRKAELSRAIALSERQVKIWFQNRRAKERKQKRKRDEAVTATPSTTDMGDGVMDHQMDDRIKSEACDMHMRVHVH